MKMFCVLAILSTLYCQTQGAEILCKAVTDWSSVPEAYAADVTCEDKCVRPALKLSGDTYTYTSTADGGKWGCGPCDSLESCVECSEAGCNKIVEFECYTKLDKTAEKICPDIIKSGVKSTAETECVRGKVKDYTGAVDEGEGTAIGCAGTDVCTTPDKCIKTTGALTNDADAAAQHSCLDYKKGDEGWARDGDKKVQCYTEVSEGCKMFLPKDTTAEDAHAECGSKCASAETCKSCAEPDCNDIAKFRYCHTGDKAGVTTAAKAKELPPNFCTKADDKCQRPSVSYGAVVDADGVNFGCGTCVKDAKCANCDTSACNGEWPMNKHKCFTWKLVEDKWTASEASVDCAAYDAEAKCSMPIDLTKKDGFTADGGCGPCPADSDATCKTTAADKNASQKTVVSLLTVLMSLLYVML